MQSVIEHLWALAPLSLAGVLAAMTVLYHLRFHDSYKGYLRLLLKHPPWPIITCVLLLWLAAIFIAVVSFVTFVPLELTRLRRLGVFAGSGVTVALCVGLIEEWVCKNVGFKSWALPVYRAVLRANLAPFHPIAWQLNRLRQRDNLGCQNRKDEWNYNATVGEVSRRIRMLFGATKPMIAARRRRPEFLSFDIGITPPVHFFILLDHFGRKRVNDLLNGPISSPRPGRDWNGSERRRQSGSLEDRRHKPNDRGLCRMGDREILVEDIKRGRLFVFPDQA